MLFGASFNRRGARCENCIVSFCEWLISATCNCDVKPPVGFFSLCLCEQKSSSCSTALWFKTSNALVVVQAADMETVCEDAPCQTDAC